MEGEGGSASVSIRDGAHATRRNLKPCPHVLTSLAMFQVSITVAAAEGDNTEPNEGMSGTSVTVERRPAQEQARRRMCLKSPLMASASPGAGKAGAAGTEGTKKTPPRRREQPRVVPRVQAEVVVAMQAAGPGSRKAVATVRATVTV